MRSDMKRKLVDTYRINGGKNKDMLLQRRASSKIFLDEDGEILERASKVSPAITKMPMRMKGWDRKDFGENLNPLRRYLLNQIGRNWDDIYSEISKNCDKESAIGNHIYEHLWSFIVKPEEIEIIDGVPHRFCYVNKQLERLETRARFLDIVWISPEDNILRKVPFRSFKPFGHLKDKENLDDIFIKYNDETYIAKSILNEWFVLTLKKQEYRKAKIISSLDRSLVDINIPLHTCKWTTATINMLFGRKEYYSKAYREMSKDIKDGYYLAEVKTMSKKEKKKYLGNK